MVAVRAAKISCMEEDHITQFVTGLSDMEDRKTILNRDPETLADVYQAVTKIRHSSLLAHEYSSTEDPTYCMAEENSTLKLLHGAEKPDMSGTELCVYCGKVGHSEEKCPLRKKHRNYRKRIEKWTVPRVAENPDVSSTKLCIGCGKKGHFLVDCDATKKYLEMLKRFEKAAIRAEAQGNPKTGPRNGVRKENRFHLETKEESETDYETGDDLGGTENESGTEVGDNEITGPTRRTR
jgi:hypothetical protein